MKKRYFILFLIFVCCSTTMHINSQNTDIRILQEINGNTSPFLRSYSKVISNTTTIVGISVPVIMGTTAFITKDEELLKGAFATGISLGVSVLLTYGIKNSVNRPRPVVTWPDKITAYEDIYSNSFPSGHTSFAFATATSLSLKYPKWYVIVPGYLWAGSVGYSRMNLGVHYPSDVIAGALVGAGSAYFSYKINDWLYKQLNPVKTFKLKGAFL